MNFFNNVTSRILTYTVIFSLILGNFSTHAMLAFPQDDCNVTNGTATCRYNPARSQVCPQQTVYDYGLGFLMGCASGIMANYVTKIVDTCCDKYCSKRMSCCGSSKKIKRDAAHIAAAGAPDGLPGAEDPATPSSKSKPKDAEMVK